MRILKECWSAAPGGTIAFVILSVLNVAVIIR